MENPDDLLKNVYDANMIQHKRAVSASAYEEKVVKKLLAHAKLSEQGAVLARRAKETTGRAKVTFAWFYEEHPDFPLWMAVNKVPYVHQISMPTLFNKLPSTSFFKTWEEVCDENPDEAKATALIFDWPGVQGTQMVIHNWKIILESDNQVRLIRQVGQGKHKQLVCIEQFEPFLDNVLLEWV